MMEALRGEPGPSLAPVGARPRRKTAPMEKITATLLSIGAAMLSAKVARAVSTLRVDDVLRPFGLAQRHGEWPAKVAFLGAGLLLGGVGVVLFAPASGA